RTRRAAPLLGRVAGLLLMLTGGYVAWYGWYEIRLFSGADADDPLVGAAGRLQGAISGRLAGLGPWAVAALAGALLLVAVGLTVARRRRATGRSTPSPERVDAA
ncbi:MAG: cytochrome c biogenesis protein CcdA, partial [Micromonospora sp.]